MTGWETKMRQSVMALCRIMQILRALRRDTRCCLKLERQVVLAEIEFDGRAFLSALPDGFEPLVARAAVGGLVPHQRHGFARLDALADVEEAIFLAVLRDEDLGDQFIRGVFYLE